MASVEENKFDAFQVLGLQHLLHLDEEELRVKYMERGRAAHPDHGGDEKLSAEVNKAFEILRSPESRLKHLLEIAGPTEAKQWRTVPLDEEMMKVFGRLGTALRQANQLVGKLNAAKSSLARALLTRDLLQMRENLEEIGFEVERSKEELQSGFKGMDDRIKNGDPHVWQEVAISQAKLAYLARWQRQIREALLQLVVDG